MKLAQFSQFERVGNNLWKADGKYYRLTGKGITPNGCWVTAPEMHQITDIDTATGQDVQGAEIIKFDITGTVPAHALNT